MSVVNECYSYLLTFQRWSMEPSARQHLQHLYSEHHDWLLGWLGRRVGSHADAADLTQDTFFRVLVSPASAPVAEPRAYLLTLARRLTIDLWRSRDVENRYLRALAEAPEPVEVSPETLVMLKQAVIEIARLLDGLPLPVKHAFLLSRLDGMTHPAIARTLGVSVATVERHIKRAFLHCLTSRDIKP